MCSRRGARICAHATPRRAQATFWAQLTVVHGRKHPWLSGVDVDALDAVGARRKFPLRAHSTKTRVRKATAGTKSCEQDDEQQFSCEYCVSAVGSACGQHRAGPALAEKASHDVRAQGSQQSVGLRTLMLAEAASSRLAPLRGEATRW